MGYSRQIRTRIHFARKVLPQKPILNIIRHRLVVLGMKHYGYYLLIARSLHAPARMILWVTSKCTDYERKEQENARLITLRPSLLYCCARSVINRIMAEEVPAPEHRSINFSLVSCSFRLYLLTYRPPRTTILPHLNVIPLRNQLFNSSGLPYVYL